MRSLSSMIETALEQTSQINHAVDRLRNANRNLTGGTGAAPTPIPTGQPGAVKEDPREPPLMARMSLALDLLTEATTDLRNEIGYLENHSETADNQTKMTTAQGSGVKPAW